jgi:hypothetical protein
MNPDFLTEIINKCKEVPGAGNRSAAEGSAQVAVNELQYCTRLRGASWEFLPSLFSLLAGWVDEFDEWKLW